MFKVLVGVLYFALQMADPSRMNVRENIRVGIFLEMSKIRESLYLAIAKSMNYKCSARLSMLLCGCHLLLIVELPCSTFPGGLAASMDALVVGALRTLFPAFSLSKAFLKCPSKSPSHPCAILPYCWCSPLQCVPLPESVQSTARTDSG